MNAHNYNGSPERQDGHETNYDDAELAERGLKRLDIDEHIEMGWIIDLLPRDCAI